MKYYAFLNNSVNKRMGGLFGGCGYANGYVAVPPTNEFHGKKYFEGVEDEIDIHGGLTFSESMEKLKGDWGEDVECIDFNSLDEIPNDYWVFGFDTMHCGDGPHLTRGWCIRETSYLMEQLLDHETY